MPNKSEEGKLIGKITHYFGNIGVAVIELSDKLKVGDTVRIVGGEVDFEQEIGSMEVEHQKVKEGKVGTVYLTEGVSRLSRDRDRIIPYQLLKLLKEHSVRIRTLDGVWNPAIDRDHDYLADEFEGGEVRRNRGLRESWCVGFIDHLYERHSDFEPD